MATRNMTSTIQVRRDMATNWESKNPILAAGEFGYDTTNATVKIGDGATPWKNLIGLMRNYVVYGVKIDRANSNPETAVTYTDDAAGFTPATATSAGSWADKYPYDQIRPCLFKSGKVIGYLNPNNYAQYEDGTAATIDTYDGGDVMVEFPKVYYKIYQDTNYTYVKISNSAASMVDGFTDWAFSYKGSVKDRFYIGAYKAPKYSGKLSSISGQPLAISLTIGAARSAAHACGGGYEITPYNKLILLQVLYLIRFKNLDSQTALGQGYVSEWSSKPTGATNTNGLYYGLSSQTSRVKCHGIEDFWGNIAEFVDGLEQSNYEIYITDGNFNNTATDYTIVADFPSANNGYISNIQGTNNLGFLTAKNNGSSSTYFTDEGGGFPGAKISVPTFGGGYHGNLGAGVFNLILNVEPSYNTAACGARLCFCG